MPNSPNLGKAQLAKPSHSPLPHTGVGARNYKTVRLSRGKHRSPEEGVCVMELASMLTGAVLSDRVYRVDPAISAFLWGYNDRIDDDLRQDFHPYTAAVLGTSRGVEVAERRAQLCRIWAHHLRSARSWRLPWALRFRRCAPVDLLDCEFAGLYAARMAVADRAWHDRTLKFIDMLISLALRPRSPRRRRPGHPPGWPGPQAAVSSASARSWTSFCSNSAYRSTRFLAVATGLWGERPRRSGRRAGSLAP